jgi:hypothetical protein
MVLSTEESVFLVDYVFREGNRYTNLVQEQFAEKVHSDFPNALHYKNATDYLHITAFIAVVGRII